MNKSILYICKSTEEIEGKEFNLLKKKTTEPALERKGLFFQ